MTAARRFANRRVKRFPQKKEEVCVTKKERLKQDIEMLELKDKTLKYINSKLEVTK